MSAALDPGSDTAGKIKILQKMDVAGNGSLCDGVKRDNQGDADAGPLQLLCHADCRAGAKRMAYQDNGAHAAALAILNGLGSEGLPKCMIGYRCVDIPLAELIRELIKPWRQDVGQATQQIDFSMHTGTRRSRGCRRCAKHEKDDGQALDREARHRAENTKHQVKLSVVPAKLLTMGMAG
ncbi:hypothetical protein [Bradyrhizobium sp.]|uniref:hypothetical protein n=1 Tax=Bradyrhizobium sp. TaxID=376 RepID=UPI0025BD9FE8|nr:hypothetical protein [Bradyrhizobium sp.]